MKKLHDVQIGIFMLVLLLALSATAALANHRDARLFCELTLSPQCCEVIPSNNLGANEDPYFHYRWQDQANKGYFDDLVTQYWYNDFHCFTTANGKADLYSTTRYTNGDLFVSHGRPFSSCGTGLD